MTEQRDYDILHALKARLELDAELGADFLALPGGLPALTAPRKPTRMPTPRASLSETAQPKSDDVRPRAEPSVVVPPPNHGEGERSFAAAPSGQPLPDSYISLVPYVEPPRNEAKEAALAGLREECLSCAGCVLCERRTHAAWGEGSLDAEVMFIGEGPGRDEDREGRPFVGRSGRLLTDIIEKGMKQPRGQVYIANVVKCRPPGNRDPKPEEISACSRYLDRQIEVIAPKVIVAVGGVSGCALLGLPPRSGGLRGKWHQYRGVPMRVIFHPSYLLRQRRAENDRTSADRDTWNDILQVMAKVEELKGQGASG